MDFGENHVKSLLILAKEMEEITELMCEIHNEIIEMSEWVTYLHPHEMSDDYEKYASDHMKGLAARLMDEIQRIYPVSY